jgi:hypothetical protein
MKAVSLVSMAVLTDKNTNLNGGRPRKRFTLNLDKTERRLCIFLGYAKDDIKKGEEVSITIGAFEELMNTDSIQGRVSIKVSNRLTPCQTIVRRIFNGISRKIPSYPQ